MIRRLLDLFSEYELVSQDVTEVISTSPGEVICYPHYRNWWTVWYIRKKQGGK